MPYPIIILDNQFLKYAIPEIQKANFSIKVLIYEFRFSDNSTFGFGNDLLSTFRACSANGVSVEFIVNGELLKRALLVRGLKARVVKSSRTMHAKCILIDDRIAIIGSHNYSKGGLLLNHEVSVIVDLTHTNNQLSQYFRHL